MGHSGGVQGFGGPQTGPSTGRLALVAEPRDRSRGARVYACNPDGSGLKLLTPAEEDPLPIFVFPETGTPAFEWP